MIRTGDFEFEETDALREYLQAGSKFLECLGPLIPGGVGVYQLCEDSLRPVYISDGVMSMEHGVSAHMYERTQQGMEMILPAKDFENLCRKAVGAKENHTLIDCVVRYHKTEKQDSWMWVRGRHLEETVGQDLFLFLFMDVEKYIITEQELEIQTERYRLLEQTSHEILFEIDVVKDVMTYSYQELDGDYIRRRIPHYSGFSKNNPLIHPDFQEMFYSHLTIAMHQKTDAQLEYLGKISGRGYEWHRACYNSIVDDAGNVVRVVGRIKNIHDEMLRRMSNKEKQNTQGYGKSQIQNRIQTKIDNSEMEDSHCMALFSIRHFKKIIEQNGIACADTITRKVESLLAEISAGKLLYGTMGDGRFLIYEKNGSEEDFDAKMEQLISSVENWDHQIAGLSLTCCVGSAAVQGVVDYTFFYQEVEEALHIAKITRDERYVRV